MNVAGVTVLMDVVCCSQRKGVDLRTLALSNIVLIESICIFKKIASIGIQFGLESVQASRAQPQIDSEIIDCLHSEYFL